MDYDDRLAECVNFTCRPQEMKKDEKNEAVRKHGAACVHEPTEAAAAIARG